MEGHCQVIWQRMWIQGGLGTKSFILPHVLIVCQALVIWGEKKISAHVDLTFLCQETESKTSKLYVMLESGNYYGEKYIWAVRWGLLGEEGCVQF